MCSDDEFVQINNIINPCLYDENQEPHKLYQITSEKGSICANIKYIDKYKYIPTFVIFKYEIDNYDCTLTSYLVSDDEITYKQHLRMIGFVIEDNNVQIGEINFVFIPDTDIDLNTDNIKINGHFEIHALSEKTKKVDIIKYINEYIGKEESIYTLSEVLINYDITKFKN